MKNSVLSFLPALAALTSALSIGPSFDTTELFEVKAKAPDLCKAKPQSKLSNYAIEAIPCYDLNGDGMLNETEVALMLQGLLCPGPCPTSLLPSNKTVVGNSTQITTKG